jgi:hypothetical protein
MSPPVRSHAVHARLLLLALYLLGAPAYPCAKADAKSRFVSVEEWTVEFSYEISEQREDESRLGKDSRARDEIHRSGKGSGRLVRGAGAGAAWVGPVSISGSVEDTSTVTAGGQTVVRTTLNCGGAATAIGEQFRLGMDVANGTYILGFAVPMKNCTVTEEAPTLRIPKHETPGRGSNTVPYFTRQPLPSEGLAITGSGTFDFSVAGIELWSFSLTEKPRGRVTWRLTPGRGREPKVEVVRLEQAGGARTTSKDQVVFSDGSLDFEADARVEPPERARDVRWEATTIGAAKPTITTKVVEAGLSRATVRYVGLPQKNDDFGGKRITATVADSRDERSFVVLFEQRGFDNPHNRPGAERWPNWYYYWRQ